jgi:ABC-type multidrug transport system fused ATPase/permease subunit
MAPERDTLPQNLFRYILTTSWRHQIPLLALTVAVFLMEVLPLELQRRIVNDAVKDRRYQQIVVLCAAYAGVVVMQGAMKLGMNIYRGWLGERSKRDLRRDVSAAVGGVPAEVPPAGLPGAGLQGAGLQGADLQGTAASMIIAEVEPVGGFVGTSVSEPLLQAGVLVTVLAYIFHVDPWMAAAAVALFVPQLVFVPLMQRAMNRRTGARVSMLRRIGGGIIAPHEHDDASDAVDGARIDRVFQLNMGILKIKFAMNFLMNVCSHLQIVAALLLGGWLVLTDQLEIGGVVAFISGMGRLTDPWGDLVNYYREASLTLVKYRLIAVAVNGLTTAAPIAAPAANRMRTGVAADRETVS